MVRDFVKFSALYAVCALFGALMNSCRTTTSTLDYVQQNTAKLAIADTTEDIADITNVLRVTDTTRTSFVMVVEEYETDDTARVLKKKTTLSYNRNNGIVAVDSVQETKESHAVRNVTAEADERTEVQQQTRTRGRFVGIWVWFGIVLGISIFALCAWGLKKIRTRFGI